MKRYFARIPEQLVRIVVVFAVLIAAGLGVRALLVPAELKDTALQQEAAVGREAGRPVRYGGEQLCSQCHEGVAKAKEQGQHRQLSCESCHGPSQGHADNQEEKPFIPQKRQACTLCHAYDQSRPTGFPQINPLTHNPRKSCLACHRGHNPAPPRTPRSCAACHGLIEQTKANSPHFALACTVCHRTPERHKASPRAFRPEKPTSREFCGRCHTAGRTKPGVPGVDMAAHGEKYVCWQCHHPHMIGGI